MTNGVRSAKKIFISRIASEGVGQHRIASRWVRSRVRVRSRLRFWGIPIHPPSPSRPTVPSRAIIDDSGFFEPSQRRPNAVPSRPKSSDQYSVFSVHAGFRLSHFPLTPSPRLRVSASQHPRLAASRSFPPAPGRFEMSHGHNRINIGVSCGFKVTSNGHKVSRSHLFPHLPRKLRRKLCRILGHFRQSSRQSLRQSFQIIRLFLPPPQAALKCHTVTTA